MMRLSPFLIAVLLPLGLAACAIPDLVAHGIKSYENRNSQSQAEPAPQPAAYQPAPARRTEPEPEPVYTGGGQPPRESVKVETLK